MPDDARCGHECDSYRCVGSCAREPGHPPKPESWTGHACTRCIDLLWKVAL